VSRATRRAALAATATLVALALPGPASAGGGQVQIQFAAFGPSQIDVLPGESVEWDNVSERTHTVTADDASFTSLVLSGGDSYTHQFGGVGTYTYHCTIHPSMVGEVDVRTVTLGPLPTAAIPAGDRVELTGRSDEPAGPVRIERAAGSGFTTVATAAPAGDGTWTATIPATQTGDYRAENATGVSETRRLLVSDRKVLVRATRAGVSVTVTPALPYGQVVLQQYLRRHFGWWPQRRARLDYVSQATFAVRRPARVRVALVDTDGWTPIATSSVVVLGR